MSILFDIITMEINSFTPDTSPYCQILTTIADSPKTLYTKGTLPNTRLPTVAIVGSRSPSPYGTQVACDIAEKLAKAGCMIVSGLALGIDAAAHRGALKAGKPTIAVMAHGLDSIYPARHHGLARDILASGGCLVSEYPPGTSVMKHQFLARNRLVSGLADALVVVEAAETSGTLTTVMYALDQGRDVFAIPGPITSRQSIGPNRLLKQGAIPVTCVEDILEVVAPQLLKQKDETAVSPQHQDILSLLPADTDTLIQNVHVPLHKLLQRLTQLQIKGHITQDATGNWHAQL